MAWDLVVAADGAVFLSSSTPFNSALTGVTLLRQQKLLRVDFEDEPEGILLEYEIDDKLMPALEGAESITVVAMRGLEPVQGYDVKLAIEG